MICNLLFWMDTYCVPQAPADISNEIKIGELINQKRTIYWPVLLVKGVSPLSSSKRYIKDGRYGKIYKFKTENVRFVFSWGWPRDGCRAGWWFNELAEALFLSWCLLLCWYLQGFALNPNDYVFGLSPDWLNFAKS